MLTSSPPGTPGVTATLLSDLSSVATRRRASGPIIACLNTLLLQLPAAPSLNKNKQTPLGVRLLGALRVWRVARVMNTLLLAADEARDETKDALKLAEQVPTCHHEYSKVTCIADYCLLRVPQLLFRYFLLGRCGHAFFLMGSVCAAGVGDKAAKLVLSQPGKRRYSTPSVESWDGSAYTTGSFFSARPLTIQHVGGCEGRT